MTTVHAHHTPDDPDRVLTLTKGIGQHRRSLDLTEPELDEVEDAIHWARGCLHGPDPLLADPRRHT